MMRTGHRRGQSIVEYLAVAAAIILVILTFVVPRMGARYQAMMDNTINMMPTGGKGDGGK